MYYAILTLWDLNMLASTLHTLYRRSCCIQMHQKRAKGIVHSLQQHHIIWTGATQSNQQPTITCPTSSFHQCAITNWGNLQQIYWLTSFPMCTLNHHWQFAAFIAMYVLCFGNDVSGTLQSTLKILFILKKFTLKLVMARVMRISVSASPFFVAIKLFVTDYVYSYDKHYKTLDI